MNTALRERVARAVWETPGEVRDMVPWENLDERERESERLLAEVAIRVVLAAVAEQIEALRGWDASTDPRYDKISRKELLAAVAQLGEGAGDDE